MFNIQPVIEANLVKNKILDADIYGTNGGLKSILRKISVCVIGASRTQFISHLTNYSLSF